VGGDRTLHLPRRTRQLLRHAKGQRAWDEFCSDRVSLTRVVEQSHLVEAALADPDPESPGWAICSAETDISLTNVFILNLCFLYTVTYSLNLIHRWIFVLSHSVILETAFPGGLLPILKSHWMLSFGITV
jgi:hypothetical protein